MDGPMSEKKGKACNVDTDCPSDQAGVYASCTCGWSTTGQKYCDLLPGDDEWRAVFDSFRAYFDATKDDCNVASRWGECGQTELYRDWMCKWYKAEYYVILGYNDTALPCMEKLKTSLPIFKEVEKYCDDAFGLNSGIIMLTLSLMFMTLG